VEILSLTSKIRAQLDKNNRNIPNHDLTSKSKKKKEPLDAKQKLLENSQLLELSIDPRNGQIDKQFDDARRPNSQKGERDIDFLLSGSPYDEADIKTPKSFFDTKKTYSTRYARSFSKRIGC